MSNKYKFKVIGVKDGDVCWEVFDTKLNNRWQGVANIADVTGDAVCCDIKLLNQRNIPHRPSLLVRYNLQKLINQAIKQ